MGWWWYFTLCNLFYIDSTLQDTAKEFLNVEKPEKLYQLFMKGTMLDEITKFYGEAEANVEKTRQREAGKESEISKLERKIEQIKRDMAEYESIRNKRKAGVIKFRTPLL